MICICKVRVSEVSRPAFLFFGIFNFVNSGSLLLSRKNFLSHGVCAADSLSVGNRNANAMAEIAVKTINRLLMKNVGPTCSLNFDYFRRALLVYRNSIDLVTRTSPAIIIFGHPILDPIPISLGKYWPHSTWQELIDNRAKALAKGHNREREKWDEHSRNFKALDVGDNVYLQNLNGNNTIRWDRNGVIVEMAPFRQYTVTIDGSGRVLLRNRKNLWIFTYLDKDVAISSLPTPKLTPQNNTYN